MKPILHFKRMLPIFLEGLAVGSAILFLVLVLWAAGLRVIEILEVTR